MKIPVIVTALAVAVLSTSCARMKVQESSESLSAAVPTYTIKFPDPTPQASGDLTGRSLLSQLLFYSYRNIGTGQVPDVDGLRWRVSQDKFEVERYRAFLAAETRNELQRVAVTYAGVAQAASTTELLLKIESRSRFAEPSLILGKPRYDVSYESQDLDQTLSRTRLPWRLEVDSPFSSEATYANFARLLRREALFGADGRDPITGRIFKDRFWLRLSGTELPIYIETYPYRSGSKVLVHLLLPAKAQNQSIDFRSTAADAMREVERIVRS